MPPEGFDDARIAEEDETASALRQHLDAARDRLGDDLVQLLFDLAYFHAREKKPAWWGIFDRAGRETEELVDDLDCLAGLVADGEAETVRQSWQRRYRVPEQETKLRPVNQDVGTIEQELDELFMEFDEIDL